MDPPVHPAITCAENITLLHVIHSVPKQSSSNEVNELCIRSDGYSMSFEQEWKLVSALAFLSNTKDNIDHIPAISVKERRES